MVILKKEVWAKEVTDVGYAINLLWDEEAEALEVVNA